MSKDKEDNFFTEEEEEALSQKQKHFLLALRKQLGNVSRACRVSHTGRSTVYDWEKGVHNKDTMDIFRTKKREVYDSLKDDVESIIYKKIFTDHDTATTIFFAKTKMKERGYIERQEIDLDADMSLEVQFIE